MKLKITLSLLALAVGAAASSAALAQTGTITINGNISSTGCTPSLSGSISGTTITLDTVSADTLPVATGVGEKGFVFDFEGCNVIPASTQVWVHFGGSNIDGSGRIIPTTGSSNVRFQLKDGLGGAAIVAGGPAPSGGAPGANQGSEVGFTGPIGNMEAHKAYAVEYYALVALTAADAGTVSSSVDYTVVYD